MRTGAAVALRISIRLTSPWGALGREAYRGVSVSIKRSDMIGASTCKSAGDRDAGRDESRSENVLGLQESLCLPDVRSRHGARRAFRRARAMDSVPAAGEGQRRAQRLFRIQGQIFLHGCAALGEAARPVDPRPVEDL